jgi:hypothetical protein
MGRLVSLVGKQLLQKPVLASFSLYLLTTQRQHLDHVSKVFLCSFTILSTVGHLNFRRRICDGSSDFSFLFFEVFFIMADAFCELVRSNFLVSAFRFACLACSRPIAAISSFALLRLCLTAI